METKTYKIYPQRVDGPNEERQIRAGDWRDPDRVLVLDGARMVSNDTRWRGNERGAAVEPDYALGCFLEGTGATQPHLMEFAGKPPEPYLAALLDGLVMYGIVIARDEQRHGN